MYNQRTSQSKRLLETKVFFGGRRRSRSSWRSQRLGHRGLRERTSKALRAQLVLARPTRGAPGSLKPPVRHCLLGSIGQLSEDTAGPRHPQGDRRRPRNKGQKQGGDSWKGPNKARSPSVQVNSHNMPRAQAMCKGPACAGGRARLARGCGGFGTPAWSPARRSLAAPATRKL
jgi:hypothetical protein